MSQDSTDFEVLLQRLQSHDVDAFDLLYRKSRERLYILVSAIVKDSQAALDIVQDLFIDFWKKKTYLEVKSSLKTYLLNSARNRAYNYLDKQATQKRLRDQYLITHFSELSINNNKLENGDLSRKLDEAMAHLSPMAAKVFHLHYIEKLSHAEIAKQLNISKSTVSGHIGRALKQLREELKW